MPDNYTNYLGYDPNGLQSQGYGNAMGGYDPALRAAVAARDAAARAGEGTITRAGPDGVANTLTGSQFRASTNPADQAEWQQMLSTGRSDPNFLFGPTQGRQVSPEEKQYRDAYKKFMENPNKGVDAQEALRSVAVWATIAVGGGALAAHAAGAAAAGGAATAGNAGLGTLGTAGSTAAGNAGLGVFANGGTAGLAGVGGGSAGALAASGGIAGGAGAAGTTAGAFGSGLTGLTSAIGGTGGGMGLWDGIIKAIPAVASVIGSASQSRAAGRAADAETAAAREGIAETRRQFDVSRADQMPWLDAGRAALGRLEDPANSFTASPGYAFTRAEGTRDIGNSFAARGGALSGNALRGLDAYNTGLASNEFNNWWNQQSGLAGTGQATAQSLGGLGANAAGNVSNLLGNAGNARASGIVNQSNAMTGGLNDLAGWFGDWAKKRGSPGGYGGGYSPPVWGS